MKYGVFPQLIYVHFEKDGNHSYMICDATPQEIHYDAHGKPLACYELKAQGVARVVLVPKKSKPKKKGKTS